MWGPVLPGPVLPQWLGELLVEGNEGAMVAGREAAGWCPRTVLLCSCRQDRGVIRRTEWRVCTGPDA